MTRGEVKTRVRANLDDAGVTFFTALDIEDSLLDAYYFTSIFANSVEKTVNISFTKDNPYYQLTSIIPDLFAVTAVYDITRKRFLNYKSRLDLMMIRQDYENWLGTPEYFFIHSQARIGLVPQMHGISSLVQTSGQDLKIFYRSFDDSITSDLHTFRIPIQGEDCLEFFATADLFEQAQEWSKAQQYWDRFWEQLISSKLMIRNRPLPALVNSMAGVTL